MSIFLISALCANRRNTINISNSRASLAKSRQSALVIKSEDSSDNHDGEVKAGAESLEEKADHAGGENIHASCEQDRLQNHAKIGEPAKPVNCRPSHTNGLAFSVTVA